MRYFLLHSEAYMRENYFLSDFGAFFLKGHQREQYPEAIGSEGVALSQCGEVHEVKYPQSSSDWEIYDSTIGKYSWSAKEINLDEHPECFV